MPKYTDEAGSDADDNEEIVVAGEESDAFSAGSDVSESESDDWDDDDDDSDNVSGKKRKRAAPAKKGEKKAAAKPAAKAKAAGKTADTPAKTAKKAPAPKAAASGRAAKKPRVDDDDDSVDMAVKTPSSSGPRVSAPLSSLSSNNTASAAAAAVVASVAGMKITSEKQAESVICDYLNKSNRPYSAINVFDNLHGAIGKTVVPKILDKLADSNQIKSKTYGKFKLYWPDQAQYGEVGQADMDEWNAKVKSGETALAALQAKKRELTAKVAALSSALTPEELSAQLGTMRSSVAQMRERLERLETSGVPLVTPAERAVVKNTLEKYRKCWALRKRMVMEVVDNMAEGLEKKPKDVCEIVGIETDEDMKINIKDFVA